MIDIRKAIDSILIQQGISAREIKPEVNLIDDLGFDSLDAVEITLALEEEFKIEIPDNDFEKIETVVQLYEYIENRNKEKK